MFDRNDRKYISRGIDHHISPKIQHLMWSMIDTMQVEDKDKDYLQIFELEKLEKDNNVYQRVIHRQEIPDYKNSLVILDLQNIEVIDDVKIFVIDDSDGHCTMMLAEEY